MALLNEARLRTLAKSRASRLYDSTSGALQKSLKASATLSAFDIFLSHSYLDKELILGIAEYLEKLGYVVYVVSVRPRPPVQAFCNLLHLPH